jgi:precorrin-8X/cobalt-precorrin-8 methylmutase
MDRCTIVTDVTMVQSGLRRALVSQLGLRTVCMVHDEETKIVAQANGLTKSAAGIRRAWLKFGNEVLLSIGDAPTAVEEAIRLIQEQGWRPRLVIGLPVGFVGTQECKEKLRRCLHVPRITNKGTRGGSPWAAATVNALLIEASRISKK